jgi:acyl carrier protein
MTKDDVFAIVKKHLVNTIDGLDESQIELSRSMKDLGANSLDIVEIVSVSMRELKVKVPRSELAGLKDIGGLVDLLHDVAERSAAARPTV